MIDSPDTLLDLTEYRHIAGYILTLLLLRQSQGVLRMKLRSLRDADWLAARLHKQGYDNLNIEPQGTQALIEIHNH